MNIPRFMPRWKGLLVGFFLLFPAGRGLAAEAPPVITGQSGPVTVIMGASLSLSVTTESETAPTYQWQTYEPYYAPVWSNIAANAYNLEGAQTASLKVINTATLGWSGYTARFRCQVSNPGGTVLSEEIQVTLQAPPPIITQQPKNQTLIVGTPLVVTANSLSYAAGTTYQWRKNNVPIPGGNGYNYTIPAAQLSDTGEYRLFLKDAAGEVWSDVATISVVAPTAVMAVAAGKSHTAFLRSDRTLWGTGYSTWFGNFNEGDGRYPYFIADHVTKVAAGSTHTIYLKDDGTLWLVGQIINVGVDPLPPEPVLIASGVIEIAAGSATIFFIKTDLSLWGMGHNSDGQLGIGTTVYQSEPVPVATGVRTVAAGGSQMYFVKTDDTLWATGYNGYGTLGDGTTTSRSSPVQVASSVRTVFTRMSYLTLFIKRDGTLWGMGQMMPMVSGLPDGISPTPLQLAAGVIDAGIANGGLFYVTTDGSLRAWGANENGEIGDGTFEARLNPVRVAAAVTAVSANLFHAAFITEDGSLWAMGAKYAFRTNASLSEKEASPVLIASGPGVSLVLPGQVTAGPGADFVGVQLQWEFVTGATGYEIWRGLTNDSTSAEKIGTTGFVPSFRDATGETGVTYYYWVKAINASGASGFSAFVSAVPSIMQLPVITAQPASLTAILGSRVRFTVSATGVPAPTFKWQRLPAGSPTWADIVENPYSVSYGDTTTASLFVMEGATLLGSHGDQFRCVVTNPSGSVTSAPAMLSIARAGFTKLAAGRYHSLRLATDSTLVSAGANAYGQLGDGYTTDAAMPRRYYVAGRQFADMAAGAQHTLVVTETKELWGSGFNGTGQLGDGTTEARTLPIRLATDVVGAAAGFFHSAYLKSDGTLWLMGGNDSGQLGNGTTSNSSTPVQVATGVVAMALGNRQSLFLKSDGTLWGMGDLTDTGAPVHSPVQLASDVRAVAAGAYHSLFIKNDGTLWALGSNAQGQLGTGDTVTRTMPVQIDTNVRTVAAGYAHSAYIKTDNTLWVMGANNGGQLGDLSTTNRPTPFQLFTDVALVTASESYTIFTQTNGKLRATGRNAYGQMGDWTTAEKTYPVELETGVVFLPAAPTGLTATPVSARDRVRVAWTPQNSATSFELWRNTSDNTATATLLCADLRWPIYEDRTAVSGQIYYYWARAVNPTGKSDLGAGVAGMADPVAPAVTSISPESNVPYVGESFSIGVTVTGTAPIAYQWRRNGVPLPGATSAAYTVASADKSQSGQYDVVITNLGGEITSKLVTVAVRKIPQTIIYTPVLSHPYSGESIVLDATSSSGLPVRYSLRGPDGLVTPSDNILPALRPGRYTIWMDQNGDEKYSGINAYNGFEVFDTYTHWADGCFSTSELLEGAISGAEADPDGDGLVNLMEFSLGLDPKVANTAGLPEITTDGVDWIYTYVRPTAPNTLIYQIEYSLDLTTWTNVNSMSGEQIDETTEIWRARYSRSATNNVFFRLKVTLPDEAL